MHNSVVRSVHSMNFTTLNNEICRTRDHSCPVHRFHPSFPRGKFRKLPCYELYTNRGEPPAVSIPGNLTIGRYTRTLRVTPVGLRSLRTELASEVAVDLILRRLFHVIG